MHSISAFVRQKYRKDELETEGTGGFPVGVGRRGLEMEEQR